MKHDRHAQDSATIIEGRRQTLPLSLQLAGLHSDRVWGVMSGVTHAQTDPQDAVDIHVNILNKDKQ